MLFRQADSQVVVQTPAKLNLFLEVLGKRPDGYHDLQTVMVTVDLFDTLTLREEDSGQIGLRLGNAGQRQGAAEVARDVPADDENLVVRAAKLLQRRAGTGRGVAIRLDKRIPSASGLAGGSSDAAATLVALNQLWQLHRTPEELHELAAQLGSDVPFFLTPNGAALCCGRGELVEPIRPHCQLHFVIVRPNTGLSTARVFAHCRPSDAPRDGHDLADCLRRGQIGALAHAMHNALQAAARRLNPDVQQLETIFHNLPVLGHQMTGSGTAYFGLCANRRQARHLAGRLRQQRVGQVFVARSQFKCSSEKEDGLGNQRSTNQAHGRSE